MRSRMQFDYELYEVPDRTWGLPDQVGNLCFAEIFFTWIMPLIQRDEM